MRLSVGEPTCQGDTLVRAIVAEESTVTRKSKATCGGTVRVDGSLEEGDKAVAASGSDLLIQSLNLSPLTNLSQFPFLTHH